jgi:peptide subunit release factor 1 (eRF1)
MATLRSARHSSTALITLYLKSSPTILSNGLTLVRSEMATSSNIKSRQTRQAVQKGLRMLESKLSTCSNLKLDKGLACFSGMTCDPRTHV